MVRRRLHAGPERRRVHCAGDVRRVVAGLLRRGPGRAAGATFRSRLGCRHVRCGHPAGAANRPSSSSFAHWYVLALLLIAVGLFGMMLQSSRNSLLNWTCRAMQYLSGIYMLIAAIASVRESGVWEIPIRDRALQRENPHLSPAVLQTVGALITVLRPRRSDCVASTVPVSLGRPATRSRKSKENASGISCSLAEEIEPAKAVFTTTAGWPVSQRARELLGGQGWHPPPDPLDRTVA